MLHTHLHCDGRMRIVSFHHDVTSNKVINILNTLSRPPQLGERPRLSLQLLFQRSDVILIYMRIAQLDDQLVRICPCDMGYHVGKERVRRDIERDAKSQVCRPLEHKTGQPWFGVCVGWWGQVDVELAHHMARRKRHEGYI